MQVSNRALESQGGVVEAVVIDAQQRVGAGERFLWYVRELQTFQVGDFAF